MRIGNILDSSNTDAKVLPQAPANYSKADVKQVRVDITGIGKDTNYLVDQGRSLQDVKSMAGALDVQTTQDYMTVMSNTMSGEDYSQMKKDGFDPAEMTGEESSTILDHIKAVMAESGQIVAGYNDDLSRKTLIGITGSEANANAIVNAMKQSDLPVTEENANNMQKAADRLEQIDSLSENAMAYMIDNQLAPTIDNIYRASFSAFAGTTSSSGYYALDMNGYLGKKSDITGGELVADIQSAIDRFGIDQIDIEEQIKDAQWLIEKDINVTAQNIIALNDIKQISFPMTKADVYEAAAIAIKEGRSANDANLLPGYEDIYSKAARLFKETAAITDEAVEKTVGEGKLLNLKNLSASMKAIVIEQGNKSTETPVLAGSAEVAGAKLTLQEVRLQMTLDVNVSLLKRGMAIDTIPISDLVEEMKQEAIKTQNLFLGEGKEAEITEKASLYTETRQVISDIPYLPAAVIGRIKLEEQYSLSVIHETGTELKAKYEAAGQSYETLMTVPRRDMGDTISKAFQNVDDILADLGMEAVEENRKAVRILGYNSMSITKEAVNKIQIEVSKVMDVINDLTPAKTLELIRQNINPLDMKIEELSNRLKSMKSDERDEKYSSFLYRLEKNGDISENERASYIGIYRLMNRLERTDGASIGAMVNQNRDITFRSLLSGMRSSKVSMDITIDENFGFLDNVIQKGVSITDQINAAFTNKYGDDSKQEYQEESYREYMNSLNADTSTAEVLKQNDILVTPNNMVAYNALTDKDKNVFKKLDSFARESENNSIFENAGKIFDKAIEGFEDRASAQTAYEQVWEAAKEYIRDLQDYEADSYIDLKALSLCNKQIALAGNLARNEEYVLPLYSEGELTTIKLTLRHSNSEKGRVDIAYESEKYGSVSVHFAMEDKQVKGLIVCESREGIDRMEEAIAKLESNGYSCGVNVVIGKENQRNSYEFETNTDINNVDTKSLYKLAQEFIKAGIKA